MAELKFEGIFELERALKKAATLDDVKNTVRLNGSELERKMKRNARFKGHYDSSGKFIKPTGETKRSIELKISPDGFTATVRPKTEYSPYLEYGTRFMASQSFVKPTHDTQKRKFINDMNRLMK